MYIYMYIYTYAYTYTYFNQFSSDNIDDVAIEDNNGDNDKDDESTSNCSAVIMLGQWEDLLEFPREGKEE